MNRLFLRMICRDADGTGGGGNAGTGDLPSDGGAKDLNGDGTGGGNEPPKEPDDGGDGSKVDGQDGDGQAKPKTDPVPKPDDNPVELKAPEILDLKGERLEKFNAVAEGLKLSAEQKQALVDYMGGEAEGFVARYWEMHTQKQAQDHLDVVKGWQEETKKDPVLGGQNYEANMGIANKALVAIGRPGFTKLLADSGIGSHPEMLHALVWIGKALQEDSLAPGRAANSKPKDVEVLY